MYILWRFRCLLAFETFNFLRIHRLNSWGSNCCTEKKHAFCTKLSIVNLSRWTKCLKYSITFSGNYKKGTMDIILIFVKSTVNQNSFILLLLTTLFAIIALSGRFNKKIWI